VAVQKLATTASRIAFSIIPVSRFLPQRPI
jgi:hypothetical protein